MMKRMWSKRNILHCWWECKIILPHWKSMWWVLRKLGIDLPPNPAIPLLGIYPKDAQSYHKDTYSTMFLATLFVVGKTWKQPKCPSMEKWIKKLWYIYTMEYCSALRNKDSRKFEGKWMEFGEVNLEWDNPDPERQTWYVLTYKGYFVYDLTNKTCLKIRMRK